MRTRLHNGLVCTMESEAAEAFHGELWISGGAVEYAGPPRRPEGAFEREIDLDGDLVLPGFKNAHTHSAMTFLRSYADDLPLLDWLHKQVFPMEALLRAEDIYPLTQLAIAEYLSGGITANMDMYMFPRESARAAIDAGFRSVLCGVLHDFIGSVEEMEADYEWFNSVHPLISGQISCHAEYTACDELLAAIGKMLARRNLPVFFHSSESRREVDECLARCGKSPTARMDAFGLLRPGGGAYHCVHLSAEDIALMKARGMAAISCPGSNAKLASGIAPLTELLAAGIPVALGTDGPASNNSLDFFWEMRLAAGLQKLARQDAAALPARQVLRMACATGARVMGLAHCDCLAPGKRADLVVLDMKAPNMQPVNAPLANVVYAGSKANVRLTMVDGRVLYEEGRFASIDVARAARQAQAVIGRIKAQAQAEAQAGEKA